MRHRVWDPRTSEDVRPLRGVYWTDGGQVYTLAGPLALLPSLSTPTSASAVCPECKFMLQNLSAEVWKPDPTGGGGRDRPVLLGPLRVPHPMSGQELGIQKLIFFFFSIV